MEKTSHSRKSDYEDLYQESSEILGIEEEIPENDPIDFNKLELSTTLPKVCCLFYFQFCFMDIRVVGS